MRNAMFIAFLALMTSARAPSWTLREDPNEQHILKGTRDTLVKFFEPSLIPFFENEIRYTTEYPGLGDAPATGTYVEILWLGPYVYLNPGEIRLDHPWDQMTLVHEALHAVFWGGLRFCESDFQADLDQLFADQSQFPSLMERLETRRSEALYAFVEGRALLSEYYSWIGHCLVDPFTRFVVPPYLARHYEGILKRDTWTCLVREPTWHYPIDQAFILQFELEGKLYVAGLDGQLYKSLRQSGALVGTPTDATAPFAAAYGLDGDPIDPVEVQPKQKDHPPLTYIGSGLKPIQALIRVFVQPEERHTTSSPHAPFLVRFTDRKTNTEVACATIDRKSIDTCGGAIFARFPWETAERILALDYENRLVVRTTVVKP